MATRAQLKKHGVRSLERKMRSIERKLEKLDRIREGFTKKPLLAMARLVRLAEKYQARLDYQYS